jgi:hypothetical protein
MTVPLRFVIDTNICIKQFIADPLTPKVNQLFDLLDDPAVEFLYPICFILSVLIFFGSMFELIFTRLNRFRTI